MCGRYTLAKVDGVGEFFEINDRPTLFSRFNIAPSQPVPVVLRTGRTRQLLQIPWGFSRGLDGEGLLINARSESVDRKAPFRTPFKEGKRCLVPADGFYEWLREGRARRPFYFRLRDAPLFAFAGLWRGHADNPESCVILTTDANEVVRSVHDRMPVILPSEAFDVWLGVHSDLQDLKKLFRPIAASLMHGREVSDFVNRAQNEGPECLAEPRRRPETGRLF